MFAYNLKEYRTWRRKQDELEEKRPGLAGRALEQIVLQLAFTNPDIVSFA